MSRVSCLVFFLFSVPLIGQIPAATHVSATVNGVWSNNASWVPVPPAIGVPDTSMDTAHILAGHTITLDKPVKCLDAVLVDGTLIISPNVLRLCFHLLHVRPGGILRIGSQSLPFSGTLELEIAENPARIPVTGQLLVESGGALHIWGDQGGKIPHGRASQTVNELDVEVLVEGNPGWQVGDRIVIASTDFDTKQAEEFTITSVSSAGGVPMVTNYGIDRPAVYQHFVGALDGGTTGKSMAVAAEVALLSRNVVIKGPDNPTVAQFGGKVQIGETIGGAVPPPPSPPISHSPATPAPTLQLHWVEFRGLGNWAIPGDYPLHFHYSGRMANDLGDKFGVVDSCSFHHNFNKSIVVHQTESVEVTNNVSYHTLGRAYYLVDGLEHGCTLTGNIGISTLSANVTAAAGPHFFPQDNNPATFWISTIDGTFDNNISAGCEGTGFWIENPHESFSVHGIDSSLLPIPDPKVVSSPTTKWSFNGNVSHSNKLHGYFADHRPYLFGSDPVDSSFVISDFSAYKCQRYGVFSRTFGHLTWDGLRIADCQVAIYAATTAYPLVDGEGTTTFRDVLAIGDSLNVGSTAGWDDPEELLVQRSLVPSSLNISPELANPGVFGLELYDGLVVVEDAEFINFQDSALPTSGDRHGAAIVNRLIDLAFAIDPRNTVMSTTFTNANKLWFRAATTSPKFNATNLVTVWDPDGSISGFPTPPNGVGQSVTAAYIVADQSIMLPDGASKTPASPPVLDAPIWIADWNAWIVPDLPQALPNEPGRGLIQILFYDELLSFGYSGASPVAAYMELKRDPAQSTASYQSHHGENVLSAQLSNVYPFNVKQGHVYEVVPPRPTAGGLPISFADFRIAVRFGKPGDWITLKIPVSSVGFSPTISALHHVEFVVHQRLDCLTFPGFLPPSSPPSLGDVPSYPAEAAPVPFYNPAVNVLTAGSTPGIILPPTPLLPPTTAPTAAQLMTSPFGLAWHYDAINKFLYVRVALVDYRMITVFPIAWFLPQGYATALINDLYKGGMVLVRVKTQ